MSAGDFVWCALCGREKLKERIRHPPPLGSDASAYCLHPSHIYDQPLPPCESRGVERIAILRDALAGALRGLGGCITDPPCGGCPYCNGKAVLDVDVW